MPTQQDLSRVITNNLCIGCGACVQADPSLRLELDERSQSFRPSGLGNAAAAAVCPAAQVDFDGLHKLVFGDAPVTPLGVISTVMLAQSTDVDRNRSASSGGLIKELLHELLSREEVTGIIALAHMEGLRFEPKLLTQPAEIDELPGSIYHAISFERALQLLRENDGRFVLVAIPCQLEGIYSYIRQNRPELMERIYCTIGLICGWQYTHHAIRAICSFKGADFDAITDIAFRGDGPVGRLRITTPAGETSVHRRVDFGYQVAFDRSFNIPRCHVCVDHSNFLADIVVGDAWLPSTVRTQTGISLIVCRTPRMTELMRKLDNDQRIVIADVSTEEIIESQTRRIAYGDFAYAYADYLKQRGKYTPEMAGPNRVAAELVPEGVVHRFHRELERKLALQQQRRYRRLYWRKLTVEIRPFLMRYVRWFLVRVLKIKSLLGMRKEIEHEKLRGFR